MWDWIAYYGPSLLALSGILVAYQIGHARGWKEGYHTSEVMYEQSLVDEAKAWDAIEEDDTDGTEA